MSEKEVKSLSDDVAGLSKKIQTELIYDKETKIVSEKEKAGSCYEENLPEGITPAVVKALSDYNSTYVAAGVHAFGTIAVAAMAKDKSLDRVSGEIKMGHRDVLSATIDRQRQYANHLGGGEQIVKHGVVTPDYEVRAGKNAGQLKIARQLIAELAAEKLVK